MVKPELGMKRVCVACATRFYDLTKIPAVCPKCGTVQPIEQPRPKRGGGNVTEEKRVKKAVVPGLEDGDVEVEAAEDEAINRQAIAYLNRLSDHLFVMSRHVNARAGGDVLWVPGQNR